MRILVFGAGAIGTYIGGSLALAGEDVVFSGTGRCGCPTPENRP